MKRKGSNNVYINTEVDIEAKDMNGTDPNDVRLCNEGFEMSEFVKHNKRFSEIHEVIREGRMDLVEEIISKTKKGKDFNKLDDIGMSALHHATRYNRVDAIVKLLEHGAKVDLITRDDNNTALHIAARFGWEEATRTLLHYHASSQTPNVNGTTPLHFACRRGNKQVVELLLGTPQLDIEARDKSLMTPLHMACIQGDGDICAMLLEKGADYETEAIDKMSPLHSAVVMGNIAVTKAIITKAMTSPSKLDSIAHARDVDGNTILHLCAAANNAEVARILLTHGADVNSRKSNLLTPLHVACTHGSIDVIRLLVDKGADMQAKNSEGKTPLHMAASLGSPDAVRYLLSFRISVDDRDYGSRTPLLSAIITDRTDNVLLLLANGADINACDAQMKNCVHLAVQAENVAALNVILQQNKCDENLYSADVTERVPLHYAAECQDIKILQALLRKQSRFAFQDENQKTPLHLASAAGRSLHVEALIQAGSAVNERDEEGRTALHLAADKGNRKVVSLLVRRGADINVRDNNRWTPLMCAAYTGSLKTISELLENGATVDDVNDAGDTCLLIAANRNHVTLVKTLLDNGACATHHNTDGLGIIDVAVKCDAMDVIMAACNHQRWQEILKDKGLEGQSNMKQLIQHRPDAAKIIMDRCIERSTQMNSNDPDYSITYDFSLLDPGPDDPAALQGNRYFGPLSMVQYDRKSLLLHPLTQRLLDKKWTSFGKSVYYISFTVYLLFVCFFSYFLVSERATANFRQSSNPNTTQKASSFFANTLRDDFANVLPYIVVVFAALQMLKELLQILIQGFKYFTQITNLLEWLLYSTSLVFMIPNVADHDWVDENFGSLKNPFNLWIVGIVAVFLSYGNLVLFLRRFMMIGIYVSMFLEVMKSVLKVLLAFGVFILAFAIVFYCLFREVDAYQSVGLSFLKVFVMMVGEIDYTDNFISTIDTYSTTSKNPNNPFPEIAFTFCALLLIILTITLMNLMVGIAVGDIESIRRNATLNRLAMQVEFVAQIETTYPRFITRMSYHPSIVVKPNCTTLKSRMTRMWSDYGSYDKLNDDVNKTSIKEDSNVDVNVKLNKTKKKLKVLVAAVEAQSQLLKAMARKIDPSLDLVNQMDDIILPEINLDDVDAQPQDTIPQETQNDGDANNAVDVPGVTVVF